MKKLILFFFICTSLNVFSQKKSFFGVNAGINVANQRQHITYTAGSTFVSEQTTFLQNTVKPVVSIFYQYGFNEKIGLRLNAQYMELGYDNKNSPDGNLNINYLTLPLTFHYSVTQHLSFNAGPYLSFTLGGTKINNQPITETYHHNDRGFSFGAEHDIYKGLAVNINYVFGLMNVWLNDTYNGGTYTIHTKVTNRALQISLIYKFNFKKSS
jgi:hypothetical protein